MKAHVFGVVLDGGFPRGIPVRRRTRPAPALWLEELVHIERFLSFEHVADGGGQFAGEDPQGLPLVVLRFQSSEVFLSGPVFPP